MNDDDTAFPTDPTDVTLELLVRILNDVEDSTDGRVTEGITLCVKGMLISGVIVSRKEFFRSHPVLEQVDETFEKLEADGTIPKKNKSDPVYFIHLRNAHIFAPGQRPIPTDPTGTFWRGRLASVDGFFLGRLGVEEPKG